MEKKLLKVLQELAQQVPNTEENKERVKSLKEALESYTKLMALLSVSALEMVNQHILKAKLEAIRLYNKERDD